MSSLPKVPTELQGKSAEYLVELVRQLEKELRHRLRQQSDGKTYFGYEYPYIYVDVNGVQYELGTDVLPPGLGTSDLQANGGTIPETDRTNTFTSAQVFSAAPTLTGHPLRFDELAANGGTIPETDRDNIFNGDITINGGSQGAIKATGAAGGNTVLEFGHQDEASITAIDFHSSGNGNDYDARIQVSGGDTSNGNAEMLLSGDVATKRPIALDGESWTAPTLQNGWVNYGSVFATAGYRKLPSGLVVVKGLVKDGTVTSGTVIFTLPVGYRPMEKLIFPSLNNNNVSRVDVGSNGDVIVAHPSTASGWLALDGIRFFAE